MDIGEDIEDQVEDIEGEGEDLETPGGEEEGEAINPLMSSSHHAIHPAVEELEDIEDTEGVAEVGEMDINHYLILFVEEYRISINTKHFAEEGLICHKCTVVEVMDILYRI